MRRSWSKWFHGAAAAGLLSAQAVGCSSTSSDVEAEVPTSRDEIPDRTTDRAVFQEKNMALTLPGDGTARLEVSIGNPGNGSVDGDVSIGLRDLDGKVVAEGRKAFTAAPGGSVVSLTLDGLPVDTTRADLIKYVLDYRLTWGGGGADGARSAYDALRKLQVILMAQDEVEVGRPAHLSLFALDPASQKPVAGTAVHVVATAPDGSVVEADLTTDEAGAASGEIALPPGVDVGQVKVVVTVTGNGATVTEEVPVAVVRNQKVLVTTDKPLYQPGQTVHIRALALKASDKTPEAGKAFTFEIEDAKGNKIARELATTDAYGVVSTDLKLARELNLGTWTIRAVLGETVSEKTITVDRYVLPKFKVDAGLDAPWYRPGAEVTVTGDVRYFFGKAVNGGTVKVVGSTFDVNFTPFAEVQATTSPDGTFQAKLTLPSYVVGTALDAGKGLLKVDIVATDTAGQEVSVARTAAIAQGALDVALVPESGKLVPGLANTVYVVTTDPMGGPVAATVVIQRDGDTVATVTTDNKGLGKLVLTPDSNGAVVFDVDVSGGGEALSLQRTLNVGAPTETVLLRTDKALYRIGDTLDVEVRVGEARERVWLDVVADGRTLGLTTLDVVDGVARMAIDLDTSHEGDLRLAAYYVGETGTLVRDTRVVFVQPSKELAVTLTPERESYLPGEAATIDVVVKDEAGKGVAAAVGLQIVDEAVFALQEVQPGLLKVFFDLAAELASASVSPACGGCDPVSVVNSAEEPTVAEEKALIAFASIDLPAAGLEKDTYKADVASANAVLKPWVDAEKTRVVDALSDLATAGAITAENFATFVGTAELVGADFWGRAYTTAYDPTAQKLSVTSNGPDERGLSGDEYSFDITYWEALYGRNAWGPGGGWADGGDMADGDFGGGMPVPGAPAAEQGPNVKNNDDGGGSGPRVREYFPETLYTNPALITDGAGKGSFTVEVADSITTWRMTGLASSQAGGLGSGTGSLLVFQDFFADIDFPVAITRSDAFSAPVAVYNYLPEQQTVTLALEDADWFQAEGPTTRTLTLEPNQVAAVSFDIRALNVGVHALTIVATGKSASDAVKRTVEVRPDGKEFPITVSARFPASAEGESKSDLVQKTVTIPENNIDGAQRLTVKVYPGFMSQVVEGMDSILQLPGGCFEQTTSSAWPNVLVTDYLNRTGTLTPELGIRAKEYISLGYQSLVGFECASGGFNWWVGDDPGNAILTAVSLIMFTDTRNVAFVDDALLVRSAQWLVDRQQSDGSWTEERHLHSGNENLGAGSVRATAYITWALAYASGQDGAVAKAVSYLRAASKTETDVYTLALTALALGTADPADPALGPLTQKLHAAAKEDGNKTYWAPDAATMVGGYGESGNVETTALVALALMQAAAFPSDVQGALEFLIASKDPQGNWGYSTQATVLTLKALIASLSSGSPNTAATVKVKLGGELVAERTFDALNADVLWQVELADRLGEGDADVTLEYSGVGNLMWQLTGAYYLPWTDVEPEVTGPLAIDVQYDKTTLATNDTVTVSVSVTNSDPEQTGMMMAEMGLPPGFDLDPALLDAVVGQGVVAKYELRPLRLVVYLEPVKPGAPAVFQYGLRARYPLEATAPKSEAYLYYNKAITAEAGPVALEVK